MTEQLNVEHDPEVDGEHQDDAVIDAAFRRSLIVLGVLVVFGGVAGFLLTRQEVVEVTEEKPLADVAIRTEPDVEKPRIPFVDITSESGIDFVHVNGATGQKLLPETMGGGCAFLDFDGDGDQDILLINSSRWDEDDSSPLPTMGLYANDGTGNFSNVTAGSGLDVSFYGMGVACGDYDADGRTDVYITAVGRNHLFHNEGDGKFVDVTEAAGVAGGDDDWGTSTGWFDYDRDGDLDLFVCNYVQWSREYDLAQNFQLTGGERAYGRPQNFGGTFPLLFRNEGNGTFADVTEGAGLQMRNPATNVPMAKSLGCTFADLDQDGWLDILVANDTIQNFLFHNERNGTFSEVGALAGIAYDMDGNARGAMGIDVAPFRNSDAMGVAIGNFSSEMTALYVADRNDLLFTDQAVSSGLGPSTRLQLTFGLFYNDCDLDGRLDLFAANGHLEKDIQRVQPSQRYEQPPQLFWNCGVKSATEFAPLSADECGEDFFKPIVGRGTTYADIDGDGDLDVLIAASGSAPRLLRNDESLGHHWLRVHLNGAGGNRDAIGAVVAVQSGDAVLRRQVMPTKSYISQVERAVTFGLGKADRIDKLTVTWPDGTQQSQTDVPIDREMVIEQKPAS